MKAKVQTGYFHGKVSVNHSQVGETEISGERNFYTIFTDIGSKTGEIIKEVQVDLDDPVKFAIERKDGYIIYIEQEISNSNPENIIITRCRSKKDGSLDLDSAEYLSQRREWIKKPEGYGRLPDNTLRIPLLLLEKVPEEVKN